MRRVVHEASRISTAPTNWLLQIPLEAVAKTVRMENLLAQRKFDDVIEQFGDEHSISGRSGRSAQGHSHVRRAYVIQKVGDKGGVGSTDGLAVHSR